MLKKMTLALTGIIVFAVAPVFAGTDCKKGTFIGSYTSADLNEDIFGDGTVLHSFVFQLTLHPDGTANQNWTGFLDYPLSTGTGSPWIGTWTCRSDGNLVVTMIHSNYAPVTSPLGIKDVALSSTIRSTYLFSIDDQNTLTRIQSRARVYTPAQDPTDPAGGALLQLNTQSIVYKRLIASDADLIAP
jgi:hypothetical protein